MKKRLFNGLLFLMALTGWGGHQVVAQNRIDLTIKYNTTTSQYEVYGRPNFTDPNFGIGAGTQISVVLPASVADNALSVTPAPGSGVNWTDASKVYAPAADPAEDFHGIASTGYYVPLTSGQEVLFFSFGVAGACLPGVRLFENATDPSSSAAGFSGGDYKNYIGDALNFGNDVYRVNYTTPGGLCPTPPTIAITGPVTGTTTTTTPTISGTATPGSSVTVGEGGNTYCTTTASVSGTWACPVTLPTGPHTVTAVTSNPGGTSPPASTSFTVTSPPTVAIVTPTTGTTATTTPTISGTATPGASVTVGEGGNTICTTTASVSGTWSCSGITLPTGPHTVTAVAGNGGGISPTATTSFTVVPNSSTLTVGPGGVFNDLNGNCVADAGETLSGLPTPLYAKLINTATPTVAQQAVAVASNGSYSFASIPNGTYNVIIDDNASTADVTPLAGYSNASRGPWVANNGTVTAPTTSSFCLQSTCPPFTLPTLSK